MFNKHTSTQDGYRGQCRQCQNAAAKLYRDANKHKTREYLIKTKDRRRIHSVSKKYNITYDEADVLINSQECHLCGSTDTGSFYKQWHIDHDHVTGRVRGALCSGCNIGLGQFKDNIDTLQKAIEYLVREVE